VAGIEMPDTSAFTDRLLFRADPDARYNEAIFGWSGHWPPPERMGLAVGAKSGGHTAFDPATVERDAYAAAEADPDIEITMYRLFSASEQGQPAPADAHWFRGALYVREAVDG